MLKTQRNYGDKCGLGFKKKITKGERKRERKMKRMLNQRESATHAEKGDTWHIYVP